MITAERIETAVKARNRIKEQLDQRMMQMVGAIPEEVLRDIVELHGVDPDNEQFDRDLAYMCELALKVIEKEAT